MDPEVHYRALELRAVRKDDREVDFVCSTETKDTYGTVLKQRWDTSRFDRNPVVLYAHSSRELPVGQSVKHGVKDGQLVATVRIASAAANPFAENVWQSIAEGTLRGISVGFYPREIREEKIDDKWVLILDDLELLELSITPLPSNPDALAKARARAIKTPADQPPQTPAPERGAPTKENTMDPKDQEIAALKADIAKRDGTIATLEKQSTEARAASGTLEKELDKVTKERDVAVAKIATLETAETERAVDALVGSKIEASERDEMVELAKSNRTLFDKIVAKRTAKTPEPTGKSVLGGTKTEVRSIAVGDGDDLADQIDKDTRDGSAFLTA